MFLFLCAVQLLLLLLLLLFRLLSETTHPQQHSIIHSFIPTVRRSRQDTRHERMLPSFHLRVPSTTAEEQREREEQRVEQLEEETTPVPQKRSSSTPVRGRERRGEG